MKTSVILYLITLLLQITVAYPQSALPIPGNPNPDAITEMLQALTAARSMESRIQLMMKRHPELIVPAVAAQATWQFSPFARGARSIEKQIQNADAEKSSALIDTIDKMSDDIVAALEKNPSLEDARDFLALVEKRSKEGFEIPMVSGTLLWNCPEYKQNPEKEVTDGYVQKETSVKYDVTASARWPMSWKKSDARNPKILQKFQSNWGHGKTHGMLRIDQLPIPLKEVEEADYFYRSITQEDVEAETPQIKIISFKKTQLNGKPVILQASEMEMEQLTAKMRFLSVSVLAYHYNILAQISCQTLIPENEDARITLKRVAPLFMSVVQSFQVDFPDLKGSALTNKNQTREISDPQKKPTGFHGTYKKFTSLEYGFSAMMPETHHISSEAEYALGKMATFKSVDENSAVIHNVTVDRNNNYIRNHLRGIKNPTGLAKIHFLGWLKNMPVIETSTVSSPSNWKGHDAVRYSFQCNGMIEKNIVSYHEGIYIFHNGTFYNAWVLSLSSPKEAEQYFNEMLESLVIE